MESKFANQKNFTGNDDIDAGCEEVLVTATSIANGASDPGDDVLIEYLDENDPMLEKTCDAKSKQDALEVEAHLTYEDCEDAENVENQDDNEEVEIDEGEEEEEEEEEFMDDAEVERQPTQVPKKRKDAAILAPSVKKTTKEVLEGEEVEGEVDAVVAEEEEEGAIASQLEEEEVDEPTSSARLTAKQENSVDEEQCRVCTTKEDLVSIFKKNEKLTIAEMLMVICPTVSIARKDFMPQYICNPCLDNVTIAMQLKTQCETTERELRKKLSRSKNKLRRPTGYVVIDAPIESEPASEEEEPNDEEFKVSDEGSLTMDDDSDDSDFGTKKKRVSRNSGGRRGRRKSAVTTPTPRAKKSAASTAASRVASNKREHNSSEDDNDDDAAEGVTRTQRKRKRTSISEIQTEYPCDECEQIFTRKLSLVLHKKVHSGGRTPINCEVCGKQFKIQGAYRTHLEKHKDDSNGFACGRCDNICANQSDLRQHLAEYHSESVAVVYKCNRCKRTFNSEVRLERHKDGRCPGYETNKNKRQEFDGFAMGRDLFKAVAPPTTTYWSDSFSD